MYVFALSSEVFHHGCTYVAALSPYSFNSIAFNIMHSEHWQDMQCRTYKLNPNYSKDIKPLKFILQMQNVASWAQKGNSFSHPSFPHFMLLQLLHQLDLQKIIRDYLVGWPWLDIRHPPTSLSTAGQGKENITKVSWVEIGTRRDHSSNIATGKTGSN